MENKEKNRDQRNQPELGEGVNFDLYEVNTHAFVLKIWLEASAEEGQSAEWRGEINDVLSKRRRYFRSLREMIDFLVPYLQKLGIEDPLSDPEQSD